MTLSISEREELELLRKSAHRWVSDPLERVCFELESILNNPHSNRIDSILPTNVAFKLINAVLLMKSKGDKCVCDI
jgi:hypothetical protein